MTSKSIKKATTFLIVIYPIISIYGYAFINFGAILFLILILISVKDYGIKTAYPKYILSFFIYLVFTRFIWAIFIDISDIISLNVLIFILILGFGNRYFSFKYFVFLYRIVALIACIYFILQEVTYSYNGYAISGILPGVPLIFDAEIDLRDFLIKYHRQSSFFREPSYFAQFLLPLLILELFEFRKSRISSLNSLFITIIIILTASGCGFAGLIVIWPTWLFFEFRSKVNFKNIFILTVIVSTISIYGYESITDRIEGVTEANIESTSSFQRVYRGYFIFNEYNFMEKIFGINNPKAQKEKVDQSGLRNLFGNELYYNGIQSILINTGLIGLILILISYINLWKTKSTTVKVLVVTLVVQSLIEAIFINASMLMYLTIINALHIKYKNMENLRRNI
jgi:hypothetical protein